MKIPLKKLKSFYEEKDKLKKYITIYNFIM